MRRGIFVSPRKFILDVEWNNNKNLYKRTKTLCYTLILIYKTYTTGRISIEKIFSFHIF